MNSHINDFEASTVIESENKEFISDKIIIPDANVILFKFTKKGNIQKLSKYFCEYIKNKTFFISNITYDEIIKILYNRSLFKEITEFKNTYSTHIKYYTNNNELENLMNKISKIYTNGRDVVNIALSRNWLYEKFHSLKNTNIITYINFDLREMIDDEIYNEEKYHKIINANNFEFKSTIIKNKKYVNKLYKKKNHLKEKINKCNRYKLKKILPYIYNAAENDIKIIKNAFKIGYYENQEILFIANDGDFLVFKKELESIKEVDLKIYDLENFNKHYEIMTDVE